MKNKLIFCAALLASLMVCGLVVAQPPGPPRGPHGGPDGPPHGGPGGPPHDMDADPEMRAFMEHVMMARLSKELDLDDEQTVLMVRRLSDVREEVGRASRQRMRLLREIHEMASADREDPEVGDKLKELIALDEKLFSTRLEAFETAAENLDDWQRARLYVFMHEFDAEMRRLVSRARDRYHEGGGRRGDEGGRRDGPPRPRGGPQDDDAFSHGPPPHGRGGPQGDEGFRPRPPRGPGGPQGDDQLRPGPPPPPR